MPLFKNLKTRILCIITWSAMEEQNSQAKEVYSNEDIFSPIRQLCLLNSSK